MFLCLLATSYRTANDTDTSNYFHSYCVLLDFLVFHLHFFTNVMPSHPPPSPLLFILYNLVVSFYRGVSIHFVLLLLLLFLPAAVVFLCTRVLCFYAIRRLRRSIAAQCVCMCMCVCYDIHEFIFCSYATSISRLLCLTAIASY